MSVLDTPSILPMTVASLAFAAGGKALLSDISFILPKGGITVIIGPNGAGKSLLLRLCHGLLEPTAGHVGWQNLARPPDNRHAMVFQRPVMLRRSARANILHTLGAAGLPEQRADEALARFGLNDIAGRPARLLSGGEQQRLAIARAWALDPELMFLDEPSSQLDPGATRQIEEVIGTLAAGGMTILMSTHDLGQARRLAARVLFLHKGKLLEDAPAARFFGGPTAPDAKAFLAGELLW